jgi:hypothetical protein
MTKEEVNVQALSASSTISTGEKLQFINDSCFLLMFDLILGLRSSQEV